MSVLKTVRSLDHHRSRLRLQTRQVALVCSVTGLAGVAFAAGAGGPAAASVSHHLSAEATTVPLVVYSAQGYDGVETKAFSKKYHIKVNLDDNSTGPLLTQIEASKNNPKW